jgi:phosphoadenylyl-sulfate reductase (thioredoxin)
MSTELELERLGQSLEGWAPHDIMEWAVERFPKMTFATGFGVEGCCLIDMIGRNKLKIDLFTLDTGLLFPETYELWKKLEEKYGVTIRAVKPELTVEQQAEVHGEKLWERTPDKCCEMRKVIPLRNALTPFEAWITAIRRDQTLDRANASIVERDRKFGLVKVNPLVAWTSRDVWAYVHNNDVPYNPLHDQNYPSIGCWPCTTPVMPGEDPRSGRWRGREKKECGLHNLVGTKANVKESERTKSENVQAG